MYVCPICGNSDQRFISLRKGKPYCRVCVSYIGQMVSNNYKVSSRVYKSLKYALSKEQNELSNQLLNNFKSGKNSFVSAVCGSGKTEISLETIVYAIKNQMKVGFTVPRRDVAIELLDRFKEMLPYSKISLVVGGHHEQLTGDLVICTTHQLYRYKNYFDLLIIDEVDAFPFKGDFALNSFFHQSIKGNYIMLSATASERDLNKFEQEGGKVLRLSKRFHYHPIPVPEIIKGTKHYIQIQLYRLINNFIKEDKQVFVFVPTIEMCEEVYYKTRAFCKGGEFVHSKRKNREQIIKDFKKKKYSYLVTTSVLERGVTVKNLQVIVFCADHYVFDAPTLIQIAGRVGRKIDAPDGRVIYLSEKNNESIQESIRSIKNSNRDLQNL